MTTKFLQGWAPTPVKQSKRGSKSSDALAKRRASDNPAIAKAASGTLAGGLSKRTGKK